MLLVTRYTLLPRHQGQRNNTGVPGTKDNIHVSQQRGFYDNPIQVAVSVEVPYDTIRYTTDGSEPTASHGNMYSAPINISTTTPLRVTAIKNGETFFNGVISHSYIFLNDVIHQPKNIPGYSGHYYDVGGGYLEHDSEMDPNIVNSTTYGPQMITAMTSVPTLSIMVDPGEIFGSNGFYDAGITYGFGYDGKVEKKASVEVLYFDQPADDTRQMVV